MSKIKVGRKRIRILGIILVILALGALIFWFVMRYQMGIIPKMTLNEMIAYTTKGKEEARITIGTIKDGQVTITVYGKDGAVLPEQAYDYEIGSLTKTFTSSLLCKAIEEEKVALTDSIGLYLPLSDNPYYPSLKRIVTHTSGYKGYYWEWQMAANFFHRQENDFYGISETSLLKKVEAISLKDKDYSFRYSNFGISVIGAVLEQVYHKSYTELMNEFIQDDLKLLNTRISDGTGNLSGYWNWEEEDAYLPAGGLISDIYDMLDYARIHMTEQIPYLALSHQKIADINATTKQYGKMGIRMDAAGICWMIDEENNIIWHNGGTSHFNSYLGFDKDKQMAVVVLSNMAPGYRIPATVMGARLMKELQSQ